MIFVGFGFLMVFLKRHCWTSIGLNFLAAAVALQLSILAAGFWHIILAGDGWHKIKIDITSLVIGDFGAGAVLITFGAILGKVNAKQIMIVAFLEPIFWALAEAVCVVKFEAVDMGGSMFVHTFGAYFGLACAMAITNKEKEKANEKDEAGDYNSQLVAMVGTLFLWCYWPSFNGVLASGTAQMRVIVNTVLALTASCISAFAMSSIYNKGKFDMEDVLNATLAGGVIVGGTVDMFTIPWLTILVGAAGGAISSTGFNKIGEKMPWHDTCGVHNLHGIPGFLGAFAGVIMAATIGGDDVSSIFAARGGDRTAGEQAWYQFLSLVVVLLIAVIGGILTGTIAKKVDPGPDQFFNDACNWHGSGFAGSEYQAVGGGKDLELAQKEE